MGDIQPGQRTPMWRWVNPDNFRHYQACLVRDLFGDWTLVSAWGGLGTLRGNYRITGVLSYEDGLRKIGELDAYRRKRGYVPVATFDDWVSQIVAMRGTTLGSLPKPLVQKPRAMQTEFALE